MPYDVSNLISGSTAASVIVGGLPAGDYLLSITDSCGTIHQISVNVPLLLSNDLPTASYKRGCDVGYDSLVLNSPNGGFQQVVITTAPSSFPHTLPYDVSANIMAVPMTIDNILYYFSMNSLPAGNYVFHTIDKCGVQKDVPLTIQGLIEQVNNVVITGNCNSFDLYLNYTTNDSSLNYKFWLQKWNPTSNQWQHPITGIAFPNGTIPNTTNSYQLNDYLTNLNIASEGTFRVVNSFTVFSNGSSNPTNCLDTIKTFDYSHSLQIISVYGFPCATGGGSDVVITAQGIAPLTYQITTKNGVSFIVNNGTNNVFSALTPATYNFQVQDSCGNIVNSLLDVGSLPLPQIISTNLCDGQSGSLSVQNFPFLNYQWWKGTASTTILSTTNILNFSPFSNATSPGIYHVRIYSTSSSCTNQTLSFTVNAAAVANAGQNNSVSYCSSQGTINLFNLLLGTYDTGGTWTETTSSGALTNNLWNSTAVANGTYVFKYSVSNSCGSANATITISIAQALQAPTASASAVVCSGQSLNLYATTISSGSYYWTGPNGFLSTLQNPIITNFTPSNNGIYTVQSVLGNCQSAVSSVNVSVTATTPNAGQNNSVSYCSSQGTINLFSLLLGTYDAGGTWTETTSSSALTNNLWNSTAVANGTYVFKYTVTNGCGSANSTITIALTQSLQIPIASASAVVCSGQNLNLYATTVSSGSYHWMGPNGFSSTQQNPVIPNFTSINNGVYSVYSVLGNCQSVASTVNVSINTTTPNAGQNNTVSYCSSQGTINLFSLLLGTYDAGGTWTETTSSSALNNNLWNSTAVANGTYTFKYTVTNGCGSANSTITIALTQSLQIPIASASAVMCSGQSLNLYATTVSSVSYHWSGPNGFSSTQQNPIIPSFTAVNNGVYSVYSVLGSCQSAVSTVNVSVNTTTPNAGQNNSVSYCSSQGTINLFTLLSGTYDAGGTWTETTSSGALTNNLWNSTAVASGTYVFNYTVTNACGFSNATVTIAITPLQNPIASTDSILCSGQNINLYATSVSSGTYQWTGPNGFSSTQQNPVINSATNANDGTYSVKVVLNSCISVVSNVVVAVNSLPDFEITGDCINNIFTLTATPIQNSFDIATVTYHWTGPNNFTGNINPIQISGAPTGSYQLTVSNTNGCTATKTIDVVRTICEIPRGVSPDGDGLNDTFNLTGFDVKKIKIFNRYGMLIYEMSDYLNQWHGQDFKGTILPSGTYYYYIELGNGEAKTGWVYLALTD